MRHGLTPLINAVFLGEVEIVDVLLLAHADPNARNDDEETSLHSSATPEGGPLVATLIAHGAEIDVRDKWGRTPLIDHAQAGNTEAVRLLLDHGANVNARDKWEETALIHAAYQGHLETIDLLLARGASPTETSELGHDALMVASQEGHLDVVERLLRAGLRDGVQSTDGFTALGLAIDRGHLDVVRALVEAGTPLDRVVNPRGFALHAAVSIDGPEVLAYLLSRDVHIDATFDDATPLFYATVDDRADARMFERAIKGRPCCIALRSWRRCPWCGLSSSMAPQ